jgi:DNA-binding transcriptional MerR regulator
VARSSGSDGLLLIGELADRTGASRRSLRYYEQRGLIRSQRSSNGYRRYGPETVEAVQRIRSLLLLGLPLAAVEVLLPCALDDRLAFEPCPELRAMLRARLDRLDAAAEDLARDRAVVAAALRQADAGPVDVASTRSVTALLVLDEPPAQASSASRPGTPPTSAGPERPRHLDLTILEH